RQERRLRDDPLPAARGATGGDGRVRLLRPPGGDRGSVGAGVLTGGARPRCQPGSPGSSRRSSRRHASGTSEHARMGVDHDRGARALPAAPPPGRARAARSRPGSRRGGSQLRPRRDAALMAARATPPFRADHVGSLLRPTSLQRARAAFLAGTITAGELRAAEDEAVADVVKMQEEVGLRSATDGELRRSNWITDFLYAFDGVRPAAEQAVTAVLP